MGILKQMKGIRYFPGNYGSILQGAIAGFVLFFPGILISQEIVSISETTANAYNRLPLADYPFNARPGSIQTENNSPVPSMEQSHALVKIPLTAGLRFLDETAADEDRLEMETETMAFLVTGKLTLYYFYIRWGSVYFHEEWHRAVLGNRNIQSSNGVFKSAGNEEVISVDHVRDEDLIRLKRDHPDEMVRLSIAGYESETTFSHLLRTDSFLEDRGGASYAPILLYNGLQTSLYIKSCTRKAGSQVTIQMTFQDREEKNRDFVGLDCNGYVYDLFRPEEPYENRGVHPSGEGIDRYIKYHDGYSATGAILNTLLYGTPFHASDLTGPERKYLRRQADLSLLNFVSPSNFAVNRLPGPGDSEWNFALEHYLTPFGYSIRLNMHFRIGGLFFEGALQSYHNGKMVLPGASLQIHRFPFQFLDEDLLLSGGAEIWVQPRGLGFWSSQKRTGGRLYGSLGIPLLPWLEIYGEISLKTGGWVPGIVYHKREAEFRTGTGILI